MQRNRILDYVVHGTDLENELIPLRSLIEIYGTNRLLIEHHKGVCEYSDHLIIVRIPGGTVCIHGCEMEISFITDEKIIIQGKIGNLQLQTEAGYEKNSGKNTY